MVLLFRSEIFFSDNTRVRIFFFVAHSANFFFQNLTLSYMTKNSESDYFFFLHQNQNIFFSNIGNFFLLKKTIPPLLSPCKLNGSSLIRCTFCISGQKRICVSRSWISVLDSTLCDKVCQLHVLATGRWFSQVSSTNKTDRHYIHCN